MCKGESCYADLKCGLFGVEDLFQFHVGKHVTSFHVGSTRGSVGTL